MKNKETKTTARKTSEKASKTAADRQKQQKRQTAAQKEPSGKPGKEEYYRAYVLFRTVLDGLESTAMRYAMAEAKLPERLKRMQELERDLMPIIQKYDKSFSTLGCPDGYFQCGGCCVPYQCPILD